LADLPFFSATLAPCGARLAFLARFGLPSGAGAGEVAVSSAIEIMLSLSPWAVNHRVTTWITLVRVESKWILREVIGGDEQAMAPGRVQIPADALR